MRLEMKIRKPKEKEKLRIKEEERKLEKLQNKNLTLI